MANPTERVAFTRQAAVRISDAVRKVEAGEQSASGLSFGRVSPAVAGKTFRIATFTGSWAINSAKTVTFKYQTQTPNTVSATNLFCGLSPSGSCDVSITKDGTSWFLLQPNLTQLPGYSASGTQVLSVISGNLQFVGTTACASV